jgi:hypothetical protein
LHTAHEMLALGLLNTAPNGMYYIFAAAGVHSYRHLALDGPVSSTTMQHTDFTACAVLWLNWSDIHIPVDRVNLVLPVDRVHLVWGLRVSWMGGEYVLSSVTCCLIQVRTTLESSPWTR